MKKVMTGMKPTGEMLHIGNLLGALIPFRDYAKGNDAAIQVVDLHALTSVKDATLMKQQTQEVMINYMSVLGPDTDIDLFVQSDIDLLPKLMWILCNFTPLSLMLRAHSYKDAQNKGTDLNMGVFNYPILMAADIIGYGFEEIPVGKDQIQHIEMARDIARYVNKHFQADIFVEPKERIDESVMTIPGLDGRKMSKSYNNFIGLFDDDKTLKKKIMSMPSDSTPLEDPKDPDTCNIFHMIQFFGESSEIEDIRNKYRAGNYGYGHAKLALLEILIRYLTPYRTNREYLLTHPEIISNKRKMGAQKMNDRMSEVMSRLSKYTGI